MVITAKVSNLYGDCVVVQTRAVRLVQRAALPELTVGSRVDVTMIVRRFSAGGDRRRSLYKWGVDSHINTVHLTAKVSLMKWLITDNVR